MADLTDSFDALADTELWMDAVVGIGGFMAPSLAREVIDPTMDVPDELYGVGTIAAVEFTGAAGYKRAVQFGAGMHSAIAFGNRFDGLADYLPNLPETEVTG